MEDNSDSKLNSFDGLFYDSGSSSHGTEKKYRSKSERKVKNNVGGGEDDLYRRKKDDGTGIFAQNIDFDDEVSCAACGFEKTFVPEGMIYCSYCRDIQYCSVHCRDWDWTNGQHFKSCCGRQTDHQKKPSSSSVSTPSNQSIMNVAVVTPDTTMNLTQDDDTTSSQGSMEVDNAFNSSDATNTGFARSESKKALNKDENPISGTTGTTSPRVTVATNTKEESLTASSKEDTSISRLIGQMIHPEHNESTTTTTSEMTRQSETITQSLQYDTYTQPLQSGNDNPRTIIENDANETNNSNMDEMKCNACGFEADFVENGLIPCQYCKNVFYCSQDCRDWDWKRGNHSKTCKSQLQKQQSYRTTHMQRMYPSQRQKSQRMMQLSSSLHSTAYHTLPPKPSSSDDGNNSSLSSVDFSLAVDIVTQESMPLLGFIRPSSNKDGTIPGTVQSMKTSKAPSTFKSIQLVQPTSSKDSTFDDNTKLTDDVFGEASNKNEYFCSACGVDADMLEEAMISDLTSFKKFCSVDCRTWHISQQNTNHSRRTMPHTNTSSAQIQDIRTLPQQEVSDEESNDDNDDSNRSLKYENVQDIFAIEEKESQYASPRVRQSKQVVSNKLSPRTVSPAQMTTLEPNEEKSRNNYNRKEDEIAPCSVCGFESEFVEGGMIRGSHDATRVYCSNECLDWDVSNHTKNTKIVTNEERQKRNSDTLIEYETIQDIFVIPEQDSQYASPRIKQPRFIESKETSASLSLPTTLPSSDQTTPTTYKNPQNSNENVACTVCGFESEFVEGGMLISVQDDSRVYCSAECQEWDLQKHENTTTIESSQQLKNDTTDTLIDYDDVNDIFIVPMKVSQYESPARKQIEHIESNGVSQSTTVPVEMSVSDKTTNNAQSHHAPVACTVCGFESEFVEGEMLRSADNAAGLYCSNECLEWDVQKYKKSTTLVASPKVQNVMNDTRIDYANIKDIFDVSGQESRYDCPDRKQPIHTENEVATINASIPVPSSVLDARNTTIHITTTGKNESQSCSVCGFESEFVEGGMLLGTHNVSRVYCSNECLEWDAQKYIKTAKLAVVNDPVSDTNIEYDNVDDIFNDPEKESRYNTPITKLPVDSNDLADKNEGQSCSVCGFESEFVEGGMLLGTHDVSRVYCSDECLEWDAQKHIKTTKLEAVNDPVSDTNIEYDNVDDIFNDPEKESRYDIPVTKLPVDSNDSPTNAHVRVPLPLSDVRNITNEKETPDRDKDAIACSVCNFGAEFVEGMLRDCKDVSRIYCSSECLEWDIQNQKKKSKTSSSQKENNAGSDTNMEYANVKDIFDAPAKESQYDSPALKQRVHAKTNQSTSRNFEEVPLTDRKTTIENEEFASCSVCGFEAEFVEGGMLHSAHDAMQVYCSHDCLEWYVQKQQMTTKIVEVVPDTQITYDNVEDIFAVAEEGSRYALVTDRPLPFDSNDATSKVNVPIQSPQLVDNKKEKQNKLEDNDRIASCSVCGFESEFVEGGMLRSDHDASRVFCSNECLEWEVQKHQESRVTHKVLTDKEIEYDNIKDIFDVPEAGTGSRYEYPVTERHIGSSASKSSTTTAMSLSNTATTSDHNTTHFHVANGQEAQQCTVCGFEAEFVEGGMIHGSHKSNGVFCSSECLEWDLQNFKKDSQSVRSRSQIVVNNGIRPSLITSSDTNYDDESVNDDASIEYDDAKDIFMIEMKESQYASPNQEKRQHCVSSISTINTSLPVQLPETGDVPKTSRIPSLDEDKKELHKEVKQHAVTAPKEEDAPTECKVCGFESTFVEEGMLNCRFCEVTIYCSVECLEWDWKSGGHNVTCSGKEASNPVSCIPKQNSSQFDSISSSKYERNSGTERSPQQSREEEATECKVCSFESTFVEDGMISCKHCENATYCSVECRDWDWESGGHRKFCMRKVSPPLPSAEDDHSSKPSDSTSSGSGATLKLISSGESNFTSFRPTEGGNHLTDCTSSSEYENRKALESFNGDYDGTNFYVDDDDASVSIEDLRDEESTQLKSIREEGSECSEEPVNEGSWRSRTPFMSGEDVSVTASQCILPGTDHDVQASSTLFSHQSQTTVPTTNVSRKKKATDYATLGSFEIRISKKADVGGNRNDMHFPYKNAMEDSTLNNRSGATLEYSDSVSDELSTFFEDNERRGKTTKNEWKEKEAAPKVDVINHEQGSSPRTGKQKIAPEKQSAPRVLKPQETSSGFNTIARENHHDPEKSRSSLDTERKPRTTKNGVSLGTKERSDEKGRHSPVDCKSRGPKANAEAAASNFGKEFDNSKGIGRETSPRSDYVFEAGNHHPNHCTIDPTETFGDSLSAITFPSLEEVSDGIHKSHAGSVDLQSRARAGPSKRPEAPSKSGEITEDGGNSTPTQPQGRVKSNSTSLQESTPVVEPTMAMLKESFKRALREIKESFGEETAERLCYHLANVMNTEEDQTSGENTTASIFQNYSRLFSSEDQDNDGEATIDSASDSSTVIPDNQTNPTNYASNSSRYSSYRSTIESQKPTTKTDSPSLAIIVRPDDEDKSESDSLLLGNERIASNQDTKFSPKALHHTAKYVVYRGTLGSSSRKRSHDETEVIRATNGPSTSNTSTEEMLDKKLLSPKRSRYLSYRLSLRSSSLPMVTDIMEYPAANWVQKMLKPTGCNAAFHDSDENHIEHGCGFITTSVSLFTDCAGRTKSSSNSPLKGQSNVGVDTNFNYMSVTTSESVIPAYQESKNYVPRYHLYRTSLMGNTSKEDSLIKHQKRFGHLEDSNSGTASNVHIPTSNVEHRAGKSTKTLPSYSNYRSSLISKSSKHSTESTNEQKDNNNEGKSKFFELKGDEEPVRNVESAQEKGLLQNALHSSHSGTNEKSSYQNTLDTSRNVNCPDDVESLRGAGQVTLLATAGTHRVVERLAISKYSQYRNTLHAKTNSDFNISEPQLPTTGLLHLDENSIDVEKGGAVTRIQSIMGSPDDGTLGLPQNEMANSWKEADADTESEERKRLHPTSIYANDIQNHSSYKNEGVTQLEEYQGLRDSGLELQIVPQTDQSSTDVCGTTTSVFSQTSLHSEVGRGTDDIVSPDDESTQGSNDSNLEMGILHDVHSGKLRHGETNATSKSMLSHRACSEQILSARDMERLLFDDDSDVDAHTDPYVDPYQVEEENKIRGELIRKARLRNVILIVLMIAVPIGVGLGVRSNGQRDVTYSQPNLRQTTTPNISPPTTSGPAPSATYIDSEKDLLQLLIPFTFDGGNSLMSSTTPQGQAFNWLLNDINATNISNDRKIQRFALAAIYYGTNGATWTFSDKWLTGENECTWYSSSQLLDTSCDDNGIMANLDLSLNNLSGSLPPEIGLLKQLSSLNLSSTEDRQIKGVIPPEIGLLTKLTTLNLRGNDLNGSIPTTLFDCKELDSLNLGRNSLSGVVPNEIAKLTILRHLELTSNRIVGNIPAVVGQMQNLVRLHLDDNHLTGTLPSTLGDLRNLETIDLRKNHFTSVPTTIANIRKLDSLDLSENDITGQLFSEIGLMTSLVKLDLRSNSFSGFMPTSIGRLSKLRVLDLASNRFLGSIPTQIGQLSSLTMLDLHRNGFNGEIPSQIGMLTELQTIRLEENSLQGAVPEAVCHSISKSLTSFALDCGSANGTPEVVCTDNTCCTICCTDGLGCQCQYEGSGLDFLCLKTTLSSVKDGDY